MDLEKRISQTLEPLSSFTKEKWSDTEYEIRDVINVNDITVFLSFSENGTALDYHYVSPISYGSLTEENRQLVDNCLSIINSLSPRENWYFEELEKEHPTRKIWSSLCTRLLGQTPILRSKSEVKYSTHYSF